VDVQFEDIDAGGVVHHPNYLKYLERARCQAMREIGVPFENCLAQGVAFVVAEVHSKYTRPLKFGQRVSVITQVAALRTSSLKVYQKIIGLPPESDELNSHCSAREFFAAHAEIYFQAQLRLVTISLATGKPIPIPENIKKAGHFPSEVELNSNRHWMDVRFERE
jgi:acyl-CoA thioester hydrolase